jgi:hypothetical protein
MSSGGAKRFPRLLDNAGDDTLMDFKETVQLVNPCGQKTPNCRFGCRRVEQVKAIMVDVE